MLAVLPHMYSISLIGKRFNNVMPMSLSEKVKNDQTLDQKVSFTASSQPRKSPPVSLTRHQNTTYLTPSPQDQRQILPLRSRTIKRLPKPRRLRRRRRRRECCESGCFDAELAHGRICGESGAVQCCLRVAYDYSWELCQECHLYYWCRLSYDAVRQGWTGDQCCQGLSLKERGGR